MSSPIIIISAYGPNGKFTVTNLHPHTRKTIARELTARTLQNNRTSSGTGRLVWQKNKNIELFVCVSVSCLCLCFCLCLCMSVSSPSPSPSLSLEPRAEDETGAPPGSPAATDRSISGASFKPAATITNGCSVFAPLCRNR